MAKVSVSSLGGDGWWMAAEVLDAHIPFLWLWLAPAELSADGLKDVFARHHGVGETDGEVGCEVSRYGENAPSITGR